MLDKNNASDLRMFLQMLILGLKANPKYPGLAQEIEKIYEENFGKKISNYD